jgi:hypothetical protein
MENGLCFSKYATKVLNNLEQSQYTPLLRETLHCLSKCAIKMLNSKLKQPNRDITLGINVQFHIMQYCLAAFQFSHSNPLRASLIFPKSEHMALPWCGDRLSLNVVFFPLISLNGAKSQVWENSVRDVLLFVFGRSQELQLVAEERTQVIEDNANRLVLKDQCGYVCLC